MSTGEGKVWCVRGEGVRDEGVECVFHISMCICL